MSGTINEILGIPNDIKTKWVTYVNWLFQINRTGVNKNQAPDVDYHFCLFQMIWVQTEQHTLITYF